MRRVTTADIDACILGSSGMVTIPKGSTLVGSGSEYMLEDSCHAEHYRLTADDLASTTVDGVESKSESERRLFDILESKVLFDSLLQVKSTPERHIRDLGAESQWPYLHDIGWLHRINRKLKHPSLTIETLKMVDGWHLVVVLNTCW